MRFVFFCIYDLFALFITKVCLAARMIWCENFNYNRMNEIEE